MFVISLMLIPFAVAKNWEPKNNDKFQSFAVSSSLIGFENDVWKFVPSEDASNILFMSADEIMDGYQITIDGTRTYVQDMHFTYSGRYTFTLYDPGDVVIPIFYTPCRMMSLVVEYSYTFLPASGIQGTINMLAIARGETVADLTGYGEMMITSLKGTGDLQNVNIKATSTGGVTHTGTVIGWPDNPIPTP